MSLAPMQRRAQALARVLAFGKSQRVCLNIFGSVRIACIGHVC